MEESCPGHSAKGERTTAAGTDQGSGENKREQKRGCRGSTLVTGATGGGRRTGPSGAARVGGVRVDMDEGAVRARAALGRGDLSGLGLRQR